MRRLTVLLLAVALAQAQTPPVHVDKDTDFLVVLMQDLDTNTTRKGDKIVAMVISPPQFANDYMYGEVTESKSSGKISGHSILTFRFKQLDHASQRISIRSSLKQVTNSKGAPDVDEEGRAIKKKNNTGKVVASTAAGALVGGLIGGAKGAAIGAGAGAAASLLIIEMSTSGANFKLASGSQLLVTVSPDGHRTTTDSSDARGVPVGVAIYPDAHAFTVYQDHSSGSQPSAYYFRGGCGMSSQIMSSVTGRNRMTDAPMASIYHTAAVTEVGSSFW